MYQKVGQYKGNLAPLIELLSSLSLGAKPIGYEATNATQVEKIKDIYQPLLANIFPGEWLDTMIVSVMPLGMLHPHRDGFKPGTRHHLVLQSNPMSWCFHDGEWQQLEAGGIYTMEPTKTHGAVNWGDKPRIHLVVDL